MSNDAHQSIDVLPGPCGHWRYAFVLWMGICLPSCMSNVFTERGFCPTSVETESPLRAELTSDYSSRFPSPTWMLCGDPIAVELFDSRRPDAPSLVVSVEPQFTGYWLIGPLMPLPLIPTFGLAAERETRQFVVHLWAPAGARTGVDFGASSLRMGDSPAPIAPTSWVGEETRWVPDPGIPEKGQYFTQRDGGPVVSGNNTPVPPLVLLNGHEWRQNRLTVFFEPSSNDPNHASLEFVVELEGGLRSRVRIQLEKDTAWVFDAVGVGGRMIYE